LSKEDEVLRREDHSIDGFITKGVKSRGHPVRRVS
jgi:hypothetical protein